LLTRHAGSCGCMERVLALVRSEQDGQKVHLIGTSESLKGPNAR